jgi:branched-chain amino acid aminotransferase
LFFTGTAVGVMPVVKIDHRPVKTAAIGPITARIQQLYFDATHGHMPAYRRWLEPVYEPRGAEPQEAHTQIEALIS